jgi:hypothetical protein
MGRIPGIASAAATAVVMPYDCAAVAMARPPSARGIAFGNQRAIRVTSGEDVMSPRGDAGAHLREGGIPVQIHSVAVKFVNAGGDLDSAGVEPWAPTDPVARVNGWRID